MCQSLSQPVDQMSVHNFALYPCSITGRPEQEHYGTDRVVRDKPSEVRAAGCPFRCTQELRRADGDPTPRQRVEIARLERLRRQEL